MASPRRGAVAKQAVQQVVVVRLDIFQNASVHSVDLVVIGQVPERRRGGGGLERLPAAASFVVRALCARIERRFMLRLGRASVESPGEGRKAGDVRGGVVAVVIREPCQRYKADAPA